MFEKLRRSVSIVLSVCVITAGFAGLAPIQAEADSGVPTFSYIKAAYDKNGSQVFNETQAQEIAKRAYIAFRNYNSGSADSVEIPLFGNSLTGNTLNIGNKDINSALQAGANIVSEVAQNYDVGVLWDGYTTISYYSNSYNYTLIGEMFEDSSTAAASYNWYSDKMDEILANVDTGWSDVEKMLYLHDYIAANFEYDQSYSIHKVYDFLKDEHTGVCDAYSQLYSFLLHRLGIDVCKGVSDAGQHAWNMVMINGEWYYVDVTHDDPVGMYSGFVRHDYFLRSKADITPLRQTNSGWTDSESDWHIYTGQKLSTIGTEQTTSYAGCWEDVDRIVPFYDGGWVTLEWSNYNLNVVKNTGATKTVLETHSNVKWYASSGGYYTSFFGATASAEGVLFYTTPYTIWGLYNGNLVHVHDLTDAEKATGPIYFMRIVGDKLYYYYAAAPQPYSAFTESYIPLDDAVSAAKPERTVTFMSDGEVYDTATVNKGETVSAPTAPEKQYYDFGGWYTDENCATPYNFSSAVTTDLTLYAKWTRRTVTVTYMSLDSVYTTQTVNMGESAAAPADPSVEDYSFGGWYTDTSYATPFDFTAPLTKNETAYALMTYMKATVNFVSENTTYKTVVIENGTQVEKPADPTNTDQYKLFGGWEKDGAPFDFSLVITEDTTLTAKWLDCKPTELSATLSGIIKYNIKLQLSDEIANDNTAQIEFFKYGVSAAVLTMNDKQAVDGEAGCYTFSLDVPAGDMDAVITAKVTTAYGTVNIEGNDTCDSVRSYLTTVGGNDNELAAVIESTLDYGTFADRYFDPDNAAAPDQATQEKIDAVTVPENTSTEDNELPDGISYEFTTLMLEGATSVRHYFTFTDTNDIKNYKFYVDNTEVTLKSKESMQDENVYYVEVSGISPEELGSRYTLTVKSGSTTVFSKEYSPLCYIYSTVETYKNDAGKASFVSLMRAMYLYYEKAAAYAS